MLALNLIYMHLFRLFRPPFARLRESLLYFCICKQWQTYVLERAVEVCYTIETRSFIDSGVA